MRPGRPSSRLAATTRSSSWALSSVIRAPARMACVISAGDLLDPFTLIRAGGTPPRRAITSSVSPNVSHPIPSWLRIRRVASVWLALTAGSTCTGPCGQAASNADLIRRALPRSRASLTTYSGVPNRPASAATGTPSTRNGPSPTVSASA